MDLKLKQHNELLDYDKEFTDKNGEISHVYNRTLDRWTYDFACHLQMLFTFEIEERALRKPECKNGHLTNMTTSEEYDKAINTVRKYFANYDDNIFKQHRIHKTEDDFQSLLFMHTEEYSLYEDEAFLGQSW